MFILNHIDCQTLFFVFFNKICYSEGMPNKMFSTRLDSELIKRIKHLSVDAEKSISNLTEEAICDLLRKYEKESK